MPALSPTVSPTTHRRLRLAWWLFAALAAFYLISEHRTHLPGLVSWLPLGLLALCPLMHALGHGHRGHAPLDPARRAPPPPGDDKPARPGDLP